MYLAVVYFFSLYHTCLCVRVFWLSSLYRKKKKCIKRRLGVSKVFITSQFSEPTKTCCHFAENDPFSLSNRKQNIVIRPLSFYRRQEFMTRSIVLHYKGIPLFPWRLLRDQQHLMNPMEIFGEIMAKIIKIIEPQQICATPKQHPQEECTGETWKTEKQS